MKKILALMAALTIIFAFTACSECDVCGESKFSTEEFMGGTICDDCMEDLNSLY